MICITKLRRSLIDKKRCFMEHKVLHAHKPTLGFILSQQGKERKSNTIMEVCTYYRHQYNMSMLCGCGLSQSVGKLLNTASRHQIHIITAIKALCMQSVSKKFISLALTFAFTGTNMAKLMMRFRSKMSAK